MLYTVFNNNFMQFPFQLLVSEFIFLVGISKRKNFGVRLMVGITTQFVLSYLWLMLIEQLAGASLLPYVLLYLGYSIVSILPCIVSFEMNLLETVFVLAGGYATQHMIFTIMKISLYVLRLDYVPGGNLTHLLITRYLVFVIGALIVYTFIIHRIKKKDGFRDGDIRIAVLAVIVMIAAIGVSVYWSYPAQYSRTLIGEVICPFYGFLCCSLILWMEYGVLNENSMKHEQELMEQLLRMADTQQKSAKEAIDIINMKCHDLKHQIKALEKMEDNQARSDYLEEIKEAVSIYDATYHTGCKALDYVLREKTLIFNERSVEFGCMAEGKMIDFMAAADIYALMGNALDNALECVEQEKEDERVISLQIKHRNEMVLIHLENRCSRKPEFVDGLPLTNKKDKNRHGFGVKSIRYIAEKYNGDVSMSVQNGRFCLDILLPLKTGQLIE